MEGSKILNLNDITDSFNKYFTEYQSWYSPGGAEESHEKPQFR
jgi:hypothetical protein